MSTHVEWRQEAGVTCKLLPTSAESRQDIFRSCSITTKRCCTSGRGVKGDRGRGVASGRERGQEVDVTFGGVCCWPLHGLDLSLSRFVNAE